MKRDTTGPRSGVDGHRNADLETGTGEEEIYAHLSDCIGSVCPRRTWWYRVAGRRLATDVRLGLLEPYRIGGPDAAPPIGDTLSSPGVPALEASATGSSPTRNREVVCRSVRGWLGGKIRRVVCRAGEDCVELEVSGIGRFAVTLPGGHVRCLCLGKDVPPGLLEEVMLGPPLVLALALRGVWCLHASAVTRDRGAVLFLGASGRGKSTLAAHLASNCGLELIADDILPCAVLRGTYFALPRFPQLKLPPAELALLKTPERLRIRAVYVLEREITGPPVGCGGKEAVRIRAISPRRAAQALLQHSVASRLFPPVLLERHLGFCADSATRVPARSLDYPMRWELLPKVCDSIVADLESLEER